MPQGNADRRQAGQRQEQRVQPPAEGPGIMGRCNQKHETKSKYAHPLKNAQRTGFQMHDELSVVGVRQQAGAG